MTLCPFATYRPVVNHGGPMVAHIGLVLHVQQGTGSLAGYFNNPASQVSAHFWCGQDGTLEQYVDCDMEAWAEVAGNKAYLSVETEGVDTEALTEAQIAKVAALLTWSSTKYNFPLVGPVPHGTPGFTPHCNPDGTPDPAWGDHPCPGTIRLGQMRAILDAAKGSPPPQPIKEEYEIMDSTTAPNGDIVSHAVTPAGHYLEITRKAGTQGQAPQGNVSIIDFTDAWPQFTVAP